MTFYSEEYRGIGISQHTKLVYKKNPIPGHEWSEAVPMKGFVTGGLNWGGDYQNGKERVFRTVKATKAHIDFWLKYMQDWECPRTGKELTYVKKTKHL